MPKRTHRKNTRVQLDPMEPCLKDYCPEETTVKTQASCLNRIYKEIDLLGMSPDTLAEIREDIAYVSSFYDIDDVGVILLAAILEKSSSSCRMDGEDLAQYIGCTNIEFIRHQRSLHELEKKGIIQFSSGDRFSGHRYIVTEETLHAVEENRKFTPVKMTGLTAEELFSRFHQLYSSFGNDCINVERLTDDLDNLVGKNSHLLFCKKVLDSGLYTKCTATERRIFFYLCHQLVTYGNKSVEVKTLLYLKDRSEDEEFIKRHIKLERMIIQRDGLVCFAIENGFVDSSALSLTDLAKAEYLTEVELLQNESVRPRDIVSAGDIPAKELYYNESEGRQIARLESLLEEENFRQVQSRLVSSGMRKGFNALFYGAPGTGKTASVLELARRSGRDIFRVDMSKLKSKWVGESEKSVRGVFKLYRSLCNDYGKAPIMLFNEADAIFGKRIENVEQSVDQMNNSLQNIILEEMENIEGILIATTNLLTNLDPAFERRFIFKVEFKMPEEGSRAKIWKSMIPALTEDEASHLAGQYTFSGGNIENIARKSTVEYVLSGNEPTLPMLEGYCQEEILNRGTDRKRIGF